MHLSAAGSATISQRSRLWTVNVNNGAANATLTIYDGQSTAGTAVAVIDASSKSSHGYDFYCEGGIHIVLASGNADITVGYF